MSQNDFVIDNGTGLAVRQDIELAFQALAGNSFGNSSPTTTYHYQWWADTSANVMKIRNSNNTDWIELFQLDGTFTLEDGAAGTPVLAFRDDLDTGVFSASANSFNIATGGSERVRVDSSGQVGINDTSPDAELAVAAVSGNAPHIDIGQAGGNRFKLGYEGNNCFLGASSSTAMFVFKNNVSSSGHPQADGTELVRITGDGNVAIGTSTVANESGHRKLIISGTSSSGAGILEFQDTAGNTDGAIFADNGNLYIVGDRSNATGSSFIAFRVDGSSEKMRILSSGEVGINLTPTAGDGAFQVSGGIRIAGSATASDTTSPYIFRTSGADNMVFATSGSERFRLDSSGRLMIGVSSTAHASTNADDLCVGNNDSSSEHGITIGSNVAGSIRFADSASGGAGIIEFAHSADSMRFYTAATLRMTIDGSGNIGAPSGTNIYNASDLRLKKNIADLDKGLSAIKSLRPVSFNWKDGFCDEEKQTLYGFIAQEVETVDNNLVQQFGNGTVTLENETIDNALTVNEKLIEY